MMERDIESSRGRKPAGPRPGLPRGRRKATWAERGLITSLITTQPLTKVSRAPVRPDDDQGVLGDRASCGA